MSTLEVTGLASEQLTHFAEHGWVLLDSVLDGDQCRAYIEALEEDVAYHCDPDWDTEDVRWLPNLHLHGTRYLRWFELPGMMEVTRQLIGVEKPRVSTSLGVVTNPHPERHARRDELMNPDSWEWHREFGRPRNGLLADGAGWHGGVTSLGSITFLSGAAQETGATAALDGSHRLEGDYASLKARCPVVQAEGPPGSVFFFTETLLHTNVPIVSENTRYVLINHFIIPWLARATTAEVPPGWAKGLRDDRLRSLYAPAAAGDGFGY